MSVEIFEDMEQGSDAWRQARCGIPTASMFATVMAKGKDGGGTASSVTRRKYLYTLAGERLTGEPAESYENEYMARGKAMEAEARTLYAFMMDAEPRAVGFVRNGDKGCSPDSLLGDAGILEIKTKKADLLIELLLKNEFPPEHKAQCQGALWVAEREWVDIAVYWPKLPMFIGRATRDETYIKTLAAEVDRFNADLAATVESIRAYGMKAAA